MSPVKTAPAALTVDDAAAARAVPRRGARPCCTRACDRALRATTPPSTSSCRTPAGPGCSCRPRSRRLAAAAVRRYAEPQSRMAQLKRDAVVAALRTGASSVLLRDRVRVTGRLATRSTPTCAASSAPSCTVSVHIGPARANRKPVLQLLAPDGRHVRLRQAGHRAADPLPGEGRDDRAHRAGQRRADQASPCRGSAHRPVARARGAGPVGAAGLEAARTADRAALVRRDAGGRRLLRYAPRRRCGDSGYWTRAARPARDDRRAGRRARRC